MKTLMQDVRYALRSFKQNPAFTLAVLASLAIGIGANTALFSVANALILRPLPYDDANRLALLWNRSPGLNIAEDWFSTAQYFDMKGHSGFEQLAVAFGDSQNLTGDGDPDRVGVVRLSSNLLPMLGARPTLGRLFTADEDVQGRPATALLMYGMWERRYGRDPKVLGKTIILNGNNYEIVGVLPQRFTLPKEVLPTLYGAEQTDILLSFPMGVKAATTRSGEDYNVIGKLKRGVTEQQAQAEMDTITARLRQEHPDDYPPNGGLTFDVVPLQDQVVGGVRRAIWILLGAVACVLLIACANVANLLLSRAVVRQKEIAVRQALGADRRRIFQQLLSESVLLALGGGALGTLLAFAGIRLLRVLGPKSVPRLQDIGIHWEALLFTLALCVFSGVLFGLAPALRLARLDLHTILQDAGRGSSGASAVWGRGNNLRRLLVVSQLAMAVVLVIGAGLLVRSFLHLQSVPTGFNAQNAITMSLMPTGKKYQAGREPVLDTYKRLWEGIRRVPGVTAVGGMSFMPLSESFAWGPITVENRVPLAGEKFINADMRHAAADYFAAMQIPLKSGRLFDEHDTFEKPRVAVVDEYMAAQMWPGQDALGKRFKFGGMDSDSPWIEVVGVVGRIKHESLTTDSRICLYLAHTQQPRREMTIVARTAGDPASVSSAIRQEIRAIDPDLPVYSVRTLEHRVAESLARQRFSMVLLGVFAAVALVLATLGIYGMMAYMVNQGTREIGIRMALGATQANILALIVRHGMTLTIVGVAAGLAGALALTHLMQSLLFGVGVRDPLTFIAIPAALALVALVASYFPARRAAAVDPMVSLRWE